MSFRKQSQHRRTVKNRQRYYLRSVKPEKDAQVPVWPKTPPSYVVGKTYVDVIFNRQYAGATLADILCTILSTATLYLLSVNRQMEWQMIGWPFFVLCFYQQCTLPNKILRNVCFLRFTIWLEHDNRLPTAFEIKRYQEHLGFDISDNLDRPEWKSMNRKRTERWSTLNILELHRSFMYQDLDYEQNVVSFRFRRNQYIISYGIAVIAYFVLVYPNSVLGLLLFEAWSTVALFNMHYNNIYSDM